MEEYKKVQAKQDESGHWYIIPNDLLQSFEHDNEDYDLCESGEFDDRYRQYRTGGDLNLIQLYKKK